MKNYAIIVAGGKGKRMNSEKNKCFLELCGKEVIAWTIEAFEKHSAINGIICIIGGDEEKGAIQNIIDKYGYKKVLDVLETGGPARQDGVWTGIEALNNEAEDDDLLLIHNGANPLVSEKDILDSIEAANEYGAAVCAMPVKDTIKRVSSELMVKETLRRSELWAMQTPQTIRYKIAIEAFESAFKDNFYGTDDVQLVEQIGKAVKIVQCGQENIKLTTPEDMLLAESILKKSVPR